MSRFFKKYNQLLKDHPYKTNICTTGIFFGTGDALAQHLFPYQDDEHSGYNYPRTLRAMTYGSIFFAPLSVSWYGKLLPRIKNPFIHQYRASWTHKKVHFFDTVFRVTIDQLFVPGLVWIPLYNVVMTTLAMHDNPLELAAEKLRNNWWNVLRANWTVWPSFQLVNLYFVPVHLRIVCANMWSIAWNCFLSFVHNTQGRGKGSGKRIDELVDIQDEEEEITMVYS